MLTGRFLIIVTPPAFEALLIPSNGKHYSPFARRNPISLKAALLPLKEFRWAELIQDI
jgi:hypothetical protein